MPAPDVTPTFTPEAPKGSNRLLWSVLAAIAAVLAAAAYLIVRRRRRDDPRHHQQSVPPQQIADASPPASLGKRPQPIRPSAASDANRPPPVGPPPSPQPVTAAPVAHKDEFLEVALAARRLSATLMNASLSYELVVTNRGEDPVGPVAVNCDMIGAHASLPPRVQLQVGQYDEPDHRIPRLEPGESATIKGELRLPLAAITPIRKGPAALFVPLARFRLLAWREGRPPVSVNRTFVVGEAPATPGAALKPFRLDLGPRMYSAIDQREVAVPA